jgi:hypothetical protein
MGGGRRGGRGSTWLVAGGGVQEGSSQRCHLLIWGAPTDGVSVGAR